MKKGRLGRNIGVLFWYQIWPLNGSRVTRKKNFTRVHEKLVEVLGAGRRDKDGKYRQFLAIYPSLWRLILESLYVETTQMQDWRYRWKSWRRLKEGTSAVLVQSGLDEQCCADAMKWYWYLHNIQDLFRDGKTPSERRFGEHVAKPVKPFGTKVECHPTSAKDKARLHQFWKKILPSILLESALKAGGNGDRHTRSRRWRITRKLRSRSLCETNQCERNYCGKKRETNSISHAQM